MMKFSGHIDIGFNGQIHEPGSSWQLLGNGYRAYNPVLMRFHGPDSASPMARGGLNAYTFCSNDPVNNTDPSGQFLVPLYVPPLLLAAGIGAIAGAVLVEGKGAKAALAAVAVVTVVGAVVTAPVNYKALFSRLKHLTTSVAKPSPGPLALDRVGTHQQAVSTRAPLPSGVLAQARTMQWVENPASRFTELLDVFSSFRSGKVTGNWPAAVSARPAARPPYMRQLGVKGATSSTSSRSKQGGVQRTVASLRDSYTMKIGDLSVDSSPA